MAIADLKRRSIMCGLLGELQEMHHILGDRYRSLSYQRAKASLSGYGGLIVANEIDKWGNLPGVGTSIRAKVLEFLKTGTIAKVQKMRSDKKIKVIRKLSMIKGIGPKKALELFSKHGIENKTDLIQAVKQEVVHLNRTQHLGLMYYADLKHRIPGTEIDVYLNLFQSIKKLVPGLEIHMLGSYRRNLNKSPRPTSGDMDLLLLHSDVKTKKDGTNSNILSQFVGHMKSKIWNRQVSMGKTKYWGLVRLSGSRVRHLDIRLFPMNSRACALLHFTGSKEHNRFMRTVAIQQGKRLSEYELWDNDKNVSIQVKTEKDIFRELGLKYVPPGKRYT